MPVFDVFRIRHGFQKPSLPLRLWPMTATRPVFVHGPPKRQHQIGRQHVLGICFGDEYL